MALRLNLYHEIAKEKQAKRRDPLKLSMIALGVIVALFAGYYFWQLALVSSIGRQLEAMELKFKVDGPKSEAAQKGIDELAAVAKMSDSIVKHIEGRFYWAPLLEIVTRLVPADLQITKFSGDVQGDLAKKGVLNLDGISSGANPRESAETLRRAIEKELASRYRAVTASFRTLEDGTESINVEGTHRATAIFQINVQFSVGEEAAAAVVVPKKVRKVIPGITQ
ncbi:MAG: Fimbrial assembly family protein [Chthoniobacteraceae bacterium]|nr:Fimbrial assembly family protein [Chthoniobacteraceae bacterium]